MYIRKVALQPASNWVQRMGRIAFSRRVAYFLNELWQPVVRLRVDISVMAVSKTWTPSSKSFVVQRPLGSKVQDFTVIDSVRIPRKPYLISCWFRYCIIHSFLSSYTLFGCRKTALYILTKQQLVNAGWQLQLISNLIEQFSNDCRK